MQCKKIFLHMLNDKQLLTLQMFGGQLFRFSVGMSLQYAVEYSNNLCSGRNIFHHANLSINWNSYLVLIINSESLRSLTRYRIQTLKMITLSQCGIYEKLPCKGASLISSIGCAAGSRQTKNICCFTRVTLVPLTKCINCKVFCNNYYSDLFCIGLRDNRPLLSCLLHKPRYWCC